MIVGQAWALTLLLLISRLHAGAQAVGPEAGLQQIQSIQPLTGLAIPASGGKGGSLRVVVVNDISGHLEVLGCLLHMLKSSGIRPTTLYAGPQQLLHSLGLFDWLGYRTEMVFPARLLAQSSGSYGYDVPGLGHFHNMPTNKVILPEGLKADLVICITPELARGECSQIVSALQPSQLVTWVHRGDMVTANVLNIHPRQSLVALSPHVANAVTLATNMPTEWALPIAPYNEAMSPCNNLSCLHGFVMQGTIRGVTARASGKGHTRAYRALWDRLLALKRQQINAKKMRRLRISVLGRGDASHLEVPSKLAALVTHMPGLPYPEFWSNIYHSLALLPCFGMDTYYTSRLSSTITASLITSTPLIADRRLLSTYTFLTEEHVFLQKDGEDEAAAMLRVMNMSEEEVFSRRRALVKLRDTLNAQSQKVLAGWLRASKAGANTNSDLGLGRRLSLPNHETPHSL